MSEKCKHHCPCYYGRGECCNCGAVKVHDDDEFKLGELYNEDKKLEDGKQLPVRVVDLLVGREKE